MALLSDCDRDVRRAQELYASGDGERAQIALGDARAAALKCREHMLRAYTGEYLPEGAGAWKQAKENASVLARTLQKK